jgi:hypothetical protein
MAANILNKPSQTADKMWPSRWEVRRGSKNSNVQKIVTKYCTGPHVWTAE